MRAHVLFAGMGGSTEGMLRAGLEVVHAIDAWPIACIAHARWHPDIPVECGSVEDADCSGAEFVGNAVPPPLAEFVCREVVRALS